MELKRLDRSFYRDNTHLLNAMDNYDGHWDAPEKVRGYGIVVVTVNNFTFAIPLRSNVNRKASYITKRGHNSSKGLDYSVALLITKKSYIFDFPFFIPEGEQKKINNKAGYIRSSFEKYVMKYIKAVKSSDKNVLDSIEYRYTTLKNYHSEFGI